MSETTANPTSTEPRTPLDLVLPLEHQRVNGRDAYELLLVLVQRMAMAPDLTAQLLTLIDIATQILQADRGTIADLRFNPSFETKARDFSRARSSVCL